MKKKWLKKNKTEKDFRKIRAIISICIIQLGSKVIPFVALVAIAIDFCSIKKESNLFN